MEPGISEVPYEDSSLQAVVYVMCSGAELAVSEISLWPKDLLDQATSLFAQSGSLAEGFSTGIGFIGTLGSVVTRSLLLSAVEGVISSNMRSTAGTLLEQAAHLVWTASRQAWSVPVKNIANIEDADPSTWVATFRWPDGSTRQFVYSGQPAIQVRTIEGATRRLIWSAVEQVYSIRA